MNLLYLYLIGYFKIYADAENALLITRAASGARIPSIIKKRRQGARVFTIKRRDIDAFSFACDELGAEYKVLCERGIPQLWRRYGKRTGLIVGAVIFFIAVFISDWFVWEIKVSGNETLTYDEVLEQLEAQGFRLGTYIKGVDFDKLHNRVLRDSPNIAWISVNVKGSVAYVEVREYKPGGAEESKEPANVIAATGGKITQVSVFRGRAAVKIGDEVKEGQLLISGVVDYEKAETQFVRAKGEVYAEINREIFISIPLHRDVTVRTNDTVTRYGISIFGREIFFVGKGGIDDMFYDKITMNKQLSFFREVTIPINIITEKYIRTETVTESLTEEEAAAEAYAEYRRKFIEACADAIILAYETNGGMNEKGNAYEIHVKIRCIANIARTVEFDIN
ncbi:MAG: sporulation protein YqfD [Clostridiales bacterium]|jgi:similar to stage IV sporulation protein|nr:sporulation protein YqfD [Clostridiales bacterium]